MKALALFFVLSFGAVGLWAQTAPQTPAPPPAMDHSAHDQKAPMHHHMASMTEQAAKMRATLEKMKANLSKISDPALKQQAQYDVDLWEEMVSHMEGMAKMMEAHHGMGMMGGDMKDHPAMPKDHPPIPDKK